MNNRLKDIEIIKKFTEDMKGVFTLSDLKAIFPSPHLNMFYRKIRSLENMGYLCRFTRGVYITDGFDIKALSQKICPESYISFEYCLAKNLIIGTCPAQEIKAVKIGKRREYRSNKGSVIQLGLSKALYFGYETIDGIKIATKEKALLDTLYFYNKGAKFYFDIYSDLNLKLIDKNCVDEYLRRYKNPNFIKFVRQFF